jgi:hypothetical protein
MKITWLLFAALAAAPLPSLSAGAPTTDPGAVAPKPLFRDPVYDGAADPIVVWNRANGKWWMFYTNRRANVPGLSGVAWVHGTPIGIAESTDGASWKAIGNAEIELPPEFGGKDVTEWAPEIITAPDGIYHLFLTVVPGIFEDWQHPRTITHLTSTDLRKWKYQSALTLASDRVIDPVVHQLPDGSWRMWYNNEREGKSIWFADSPDLNTWTDRGRCAGVAGRCEGPFVFDWKGHTWMLVDTWKGLGVYRSDDQLNWTGQPNLLLDVPGKGADDGVNGGHPGVVVNGDRAFLFYFTHPGRAGTIKPDDKPATELRRSSIQVVELKKKDGVLSCDRDAPTRINLRPPYTLTEVWSPVPPSVAAPAGGIPSDAIVLFDGKSLDAWEPAQPDGRPWVMEDGAMVIPGGKLGDVRTKRSFGDIQLHLEWRTPAVVKGDGQGRGNSGVFFMGLYELQILDSSNNPTYVNGQAAALYKEHAPLVNASRGPGEWQVYDAVFIAPRFSAEGKLISPARLTAFHNGVLVHYDASFTGPTPNGPTYHLPGLPRYAAHAAKLPLVLQDHRNPVAFRNIWVREINISDSK